MRQLQFKIDAPIGPLFLVASEQGLCGVYWSQQQIEVCVPRSGGGAAQEILLSAAFELSEYFAGRLQVFMTPLDAHGTDFQKQVWAELLKIPYGKTCSYKDIAERINKTNAVRAVGSANGKNPLCILVPCHRVISSDGSLGGYSGGLDIKTQLLNLESQRAAYASAV